MLISHKPIRQCSGTKKNIPSTNVQKLEWNELLLLVKECSDQDKDILQGIDTINNRLDKMRKAQEKILRGLSGLQQRAVAMQQDRCENTRWVLALWTRNLKQILGFDFELRQSESVRLKRALACTKDIPFAPYH
ncbi:hypothetical protein AC249_AIPGENE6838 [Exaiptasia diaphana]|nr:hypothetical protein AC249_AIPGENE6838 [Exaiptasia diaphana]